MSFVSSIRRVALLSQSKSSLRLILARLKPLFPLSIAELTGFELMHVKFRSFSLATKSSVTKDSRLQPALCFTAFSTNGINSSGRMSILLFHSRC
jgi:uncharacterized protein YlxP (DUF503 family)